MRLRSSWIALLPVFFLAYASSCANRPYTIKTPYGILGGAQLELSQGLLTLSSSACLANDSGELYMPQVIYDRAKGLLLARQVSGVAEGWRIKAKRLLGHEGELTFLTARLERGQVRIEASRALWKAGVISVSELSAITPHYRFKASTGELEGSTFKADGIWATTCACGSNLELLSRSAVFDTVSGRLLLSEASVELYHFTVARGTNVVLEPDKPLNLTFPLELNYTSTGLTFGLQGFPLPLPGESFGRWSTSFTLLATGLGQTPSLVVGLNVHQGVRYASFLLNQYGVSTALNAPPFFFGDDAETQVAEGRYSQRFPLLGGSVRPFARLAREGSVQGMSTGVELMRPLNEKLGNFSFSLDPWVLATVYIAPSSPPYLAYGFSASLGEQGPVAFSIKYQWSGSYNEPLFSYETRYPSNLLSGRVSIGPVHLDASAYLGFSPLGIINQEELVLGYHPPKPAVSCTGALTAAPYLGYDFLRHNFSRGGIVLAYTDCCFVYTLKYSAVWISQSTGESVGSQVTFGVGIR